MGRTSRRIAMGLLLCAAFIPLVILLASWTALPATVPAHWTGSTPDRWAGKAEMLAVPVISAVGTLCLFAYLVLMARVSHPEHLGRRMWSRFVACYVFGLVISLAAAVLVSAWIQLAIEAATPAGGWMGFSMLYALPGAAIALVALFPSPNPLKHEALCRITTVAIGLAEMALCGFILQGPAATYTMIGLFALAALLNAAAQLAK